MKKNLFSFFKFFSIGLKDGLLILVVLATISPFVYREVLEHTASSSDVVIGSVNINDADLPTRPATPIPDATPVSTPIPTPTLQPTPVPTAGDTKQQVDGGFIRLEIEGLRPGLWTQVQWLAGDGNWYDVNGWGGHLTADLDVFWYVGNNHLGAQPAFRWQVYAGEGGTLLATSDEFYLPTAVREIVHVTVALPTQ